MCNCAKDEGGPLGAGLQGQASNHLKLLWLRARVVSVKESHGLGPWQVGIKETSNSEPLMRHRKDRDEVKTGLLYRVQDEFGGKPACRPSGLRCKGGVTLLQAFARNLGTCRFDGKGETQVEDAQG